MTENDGNKMVFLCLTEKFWKHACFVLVLYNFMQTHCHKKKLSKDQVSHWYQRVEFYRYQLRNLCERKPLNIKCFWDFKKKNCQDLVKTGWMPFSKINRNLNTAEPREKNKVKFCSMYRDEKCIIAVQYCFQLHTCRPTWWSWDSTDKNKAQIGFQIFK